MIIVTANEGDEISFTDKEKIEKGYRKITLKYKVLKKYKHHVLVEGKYGIRQSITNADMMLHGYAYQI